MAQEEKQLLLADLCARLPYGIKILHEGWNYEWDDELSTVERVVGIDENFIYTKVIDTHNGEEYRDDKYCIDLFDDKLFLRPMSSMTEEECDMVEEILGDKCIFDFMSNGDIVLKQGQFSQNKLAKLYDYYASIHVDYRGLIPKGLALEAPEGMYNIKEK